MGLPINPKTADEVPNLKRVRYLFGDSTNCFSYQYSER